MKDTQLVPVVLIVLMIGTIGDIIVTKNFCTHGDQPFCQPVKMTGIAPTIAVIRPDKPISKPLLHRPAPRPKRLLLSVWITRKVQTKALPALMI